MNSEVLQPALICPYTLMEEEALFWSILFFNKAILLHPFPLPLPASCEFWVDQGQLQVRSLRPTQEEIRDKDRRLREIENYIVHNPDRGLLKYLREAASMQDQETQEEIVGFMKGQPFTKPLMDKSILNGPVLLGLIHEWMIKEWEVETSLADIEKQEKILAQSWQESSEEESQWESTAPMVLKRNEVDILCPPALTFWRELRNKLAPEPLNLFTTQQWVWADHYGLDPEEDRTISISLPDLSSLNRDAFQNQAKVWAQEKRDLALQEKMEGLLRPPKGPDLGRAADEFQKALSALGLPSGGKYQLILPPGQSSFKEPPALFDKTRSDPLILLSPVTV
jgi:hypothetical protein